MPGVKGKSGPPGNTNAIGNRGGQKGRSGPPGNQNSVGNKGGLGAPAGSKFALKHGVYSFLATGDLPVDVQPLVNEFAVRLDVEIAERFPDGLTFEVECLRESCISAYAVAQLRARYAGEVGLNPEVRDKFLGGFLYALDKRDQKVSAINELTQESNPWAFIDAQPLDSDKAP